MVEIIIRFQETVEEDGLENEIKLAKKYSAKDDPKILLLSIEALAEKFCKQQTYLAGQSDLYVLERKNG